MMEEKSKPTSNQKLRRERDRRCWSQQELADLLGTTPLNIGRWERGVTQPGPHFRHKLCVVFEKSAYELGLVSARDGQPSVVEQANALSTTPSTTAKPAVSARYWNVPYRRNLFFTGREDILSHLHDAFNSDTSTIARAQFQAISGLGGIGKTQSAVEYSYRYRDSYVAVFWVRAESANLLASDYLTVAALLMLPERNEQDQHQITSAVIRWFDTHEHWLLILDNADELGTVSEYIPSAGKGHILLTTRAQAVGTIAQRIDLDKLSQEDGVLLLLRRIKRLRGNALLESIPETLRRQAQAIVEAVDGLPLALDQAGAYIEETGCSLNDYLKFYKTRRTKLLRTRGRDVVGHPEPVAATWSLAFENIERANPAAANLLRLGAFLHPDAIPESMIMEGASELGSVLGPVAADEFDLNEAIGELLKYSLVKRDEEEKILNIHRLVQTVVKDGLKEDEERLWAERVVAMVNKAFPAGELEKWFTCQQYLPHAQICEESINRWNITLPDASQLLSRVGSYLYHRGQYKEAERMLSTTVLLLEQISGTDHADTATAMNDLADIYKVVGKYIQAEELYQKTRMIRQRILGSTHPDVAITTQGLAMLYRDQGLFAQAEPLMEEALAICIQAFGAEHLTVAVFLNDLALVYADIGKYKQAEPLQLQALKIDEKFLGVQHPEVATDLNNIGWLYYRQGQYDLAEASHRRALSIRVQVLGPDHLDVAYSLNALGLLYRDQGNYEKAESFFQRALAIRERSLEADHPDLAQSLHNLGALYLREEKYQLAEPLMQQALSIREQLGASNPLVAYSLQDAGMLYYKRGAASQAEMMLQRSIAIFEQAFGQMHIDLSSSLTNLAIIYREQKKYDQALPLFHQALAIREKVQGPASSRVALCLYQLALLYSMQSMYAQAELLYQRILTILEQVPLQNPRDMQPIIQNYAHLLRETGRNTEAVALEEYAQVIHTNHL